MLDGEIVVPLGRSFSFDDLLQRIHPAQSRVRKLAQETPALFIAFDLLGECDNDLLEQPLAKRRAGLERFAGKHFSAATIFRLSKASTDAAQARRWLAAAGGGCDGVVAKRLDLPYQAGSRDGMQKIKRYRSADCVIGGFRYNEKPIKGEKVVGSLLLGLYDDAKLLHHVGFSSGLKAAEKPALTARLLPLATTKSFTGNTPGGPSRWSTKRSSEWVPLKPKLVVEVSYDHFSGDRFRHGTSILRWRPDKRAGSMHDGSARAKIARRSAAAGLTGFDHATLIVARSDAPAVVGPVQQRLALARAAGQVARLAVLLRPARRGGGSPPALDLPASSSGIRRPM